MGNGSLGSVDGILGIHIHHLLIHHMDISSVAVSRTYTQCSIYRTNPELLITSKKRFKCTRISEAKLQRCEVSVVVRSLGVVTENLAKYLKKAGIQMIELLQKAALLGSERLLRQVHAGGLGL